MKKILFILQIPPPVHGASMVGKYIMDSKIINGNFCCNYIDSGISKDINEIGQGGIKKTLRYFNVLWKVLKQLIIQKPDLCYFAITAKGVGFYKDACVALLIRLFRVKIVFHFHNKGVSLRHNKTFDNILYKAVFRSGEFILLSKYLYSDIQKYAIDKQVHYCPNGIPEINKNLKSEGNETPKILFLSNLIESKGVVVLLEACKILKEKGIGFNCIYVGGEGDIDGDMFGQKVTQLNLADQVFYLGKKYGEEKDKIFAASDIFAFPTYYHNECFPLVLLEAMQHSLPVVSTSEGGINEIVDNGFNGYTVAKEDPVILADKLEILINDTNIRQQMGRNGRLKYDKEFTLSQFERKMHDILNVILYND